MTLEARRMQRSILALFTHARRKHKGLTRTHLANALGIRPDQVEKAEAARPCGTRAEQALLQWNGLAVEATASNSVAKPGGAAG